MWKHKSLSLQGLVGAVPASKLAWGTGRVQGDDSGECDAAIMGRT